MTDSKKTLLITDIPPSRKQSGSLLTWNLCRNFVEDSLVCYFITSPNLKLKPEFPFEPSPHYVVASKADDHSYRPKYFPKIIRMLASFVREIYRKHFQVPKHAKNVIKFAKEQHVDRIWIILQGQTMIWLAEYLIKKSDYPIRAQVWDPPTWWARHNNLDRLTKLNLFKSYEYCLRAADELGSASFNMSRIVKEKFGRESYPLLGISPQLPRPVTSDDSLPTDKYVIGVAGQLYSTCTLKAFLISLDMIYWQIEGKPVEIHYWGNDRFPLERSRIIKKPYVTQVQLLEELSKCHVLYCPYWVDYNFREEARNSFPSKLVSYLNSERPILFHGPEDSSPGTLLNSKNAAICCFSDQAPYILYFLRKALFSPAVPEILKNAARLAREELGEDLTMSNFRKFMKLAPESSRYEST